MQASGTPQVVTPQFLMVDGVKTEIARAGQGKTLVLLHAVDGVKPASPYFQLLAQSFDVVAPSHPGFGHSEWPREFRTVEDLVYFHMTLADQLAISDAVLVGCSFGGWLAAEIAVRATKRFSHLVLTDAYGIKIGDVLTVADQVHRSYHQVTGVFDPRVQYDPYNGRWIMAAASNGQSSSASILVGISNTSDPQGTFTLYRFVVGCAAGDAGCDSGGEWADFPMLGFNKNWVVVGWNQFQTTGGNLVAGKMLKALQP